MFFFKLVDVVEVSFWEGFSVVYVEVVAFVEVV